MLEIDTGKRKQKSRQCVGESSVESCAGTGNHAYREQKFLPAENLELENKRIMFFLKNIELFSIALDLMSIIHTTVLWLIHQTINGLAMSIIWNGNLLFMETARCHR